MRRALMKLKKAAQGKLDAVDYGTMHSASKTTVFRHYSGIDEDYRFADAFDYQRAVGRTPGNKRIKGIIYLVSDTA